MDKEALLKKAVEENLEQEIHAVPEAKKLRQMHVFSRGFTKKMNELTRKREHIWTARHTGILVAAVLCLFIVVRVMPENLTGSSDSDSMDDAGTVSDQVSESTDERVEEEMSGAADSQGISEEESKVEEADDADAAYEAAGEQAALSLDQEVYGPEDTMILSIENLTEEEIVSEGWYDIEVYTEDGWRLLEVPADAAVPVHRIAEAETAILEIDLSLLKLEAAYTRYRIVKPVMNELLAAEFEISWR